MPVRPSAPQPRAGQGYGLRVDIYADPAPAELMRGDQRRATAAEWIQHQIAGVAGQQDDAPEQRQRFLRRVAHALL